MAVVNLRIVTKFQSATVSNLDVVPARKDPFLRFALLIVKIDFAVVAVGHELRVSRVVGDSKGLPVFFDCEQTLAEVVVPGLDVTISV